MNSTQDKSDCSPCSPSLSEDIDALSFWTDMWANRLSDEDEPVDGNEREVIQSTWRILSACSQIDGPLHGQSVVTERDFGGRWCPEFCPITLNPFFMWLQHPQLGWVPTYGGPFDSYTIPEPELPKKGETTSRLDIEYHRHRFDHDEGSWRMYETEVLDFRVVPEESLIELGAWKD